MKRSPVLGILLLIPALSLLAIVGCTKEGAKDTAGTKTTPATDTGGAKGTVTDITTATKATVKGTVKIKDAPAPKDITDVISKHAEAKYCLMGDHSEQIWQVHNGLVENVVVWLAPADGKAFKVTDALKDPFKSKVVKMDQPYCQYIPHVAAIYAGTQKFQVLNSAKTGHNVKITGSAKNGTTSDNLPPGKSTAERDYVFQNDPIAIQCDQHGWMNAKVHTFKHPYFAVTGKDGTFTINNVPISEELTVWMWHESQGKWSPQKATFKEGDNALDLTVTAK